MTTNDAGGITSEWEVSEDTSLFIESLSNISTLSIENCNLDGYTLMKEAYERENSQLSNIRLVGFDKEGDATDLSMLANMVNDKNYAGEAHTFTGIGTQGEVLDHPVIEGTMTINTPIYREDEDVLRDAYGEAFVLNADGGYYIKFEDHNVQSICATNWGDSVGITEAQVASVTSLGSKFRNNTTITEFNELEKFIGIVNLSTSTNSQGCFYGCVNLTEIKLPPLVTKLWYQEFSRCSSLRTVGDISNIEVLLGNAFADTALEGDIFLPKLQTIATGAFINTNITKVSSLGNITALGDITSNLNNPNYGIFKGCTLLEEVNLHEGIEAVQRYCFYGCTSLNKINIPQSIKSLKMYSFYNCTSLVIDDLYLPNLESMEKNPFHNVKIKKISSLGRITSIPQPDNYDSGQNFGDKATLESINLPETLTSIGAYALHGYSSLVIDDLYLPNLEILGQNAFYGVKIKKMNISKVTALPDGLNAQNYGDKSILEEIVLSEKVTSFPRYCFQGYKNLKKINIPSGVTSFGEAAFLDTKIEGDVYLSDITSIGSRAFDGTNISSFSAPKLTTIGGRINGRGVFEMCGNLTTIDMPSIQTINANAFKNCALKGEVVINATVIGDAAFCGNKIEVLHLPYIQSISGESFNEGAFANNALLHTVILGENCISIGRCDFAICKALKTFICRATTPPSLNNQAFNESNSTFLIYVPDASVEAYRTATNWSTYADRIYPISVYESGGLSEVIEFDDENVKSICLANWDNNQDGYFMKAEAASVTSIGTVFKGNTEITEFNELGYFTNVKSLAGAFSGCTNLREIDLTNIESFSGNGSFSNCTSLTIEVDMPNLKKLQYTDFTKSGIIGIKSLGSITSIPDAYVYTENGEFYNCTNLEYVILPNTLTTIGLYAFFGCSKLSQCTLPVSIETIKGAAFKGTILEGEINLPNLSTLEDSAFYETKISKVQNLGVVESISKSVFRGCSELTEFIFPANLKSIFDSALYGCTSLEIEDLSLPNLESLGQNAFYGVKVKKISDLGKITILPTATSTTQTFGDKSVLEEVVLPDTITVIPEKSFYGYSSAKIIVNWGNIVSIGQQAFTSTALEGDVELSVTSILTQTFHKTNITGIRALSAITIGNAAASECENLKFIHLRDVESIETRGFQTNPNLEWIIVGNQTPPTLGSNNVFNSTNNCPIYVPDASVEAYRTETNWSAYADRIKSIEKDLPKDNPELYAEIEEYL